MRIQKISFPNQQALCVFPEKQSDLAQAVTELKLEEGRPVIVLIGGDIEKQHAMVTAKAIQTVSMLAEDMKALIISGGTDMGVMAEIGRARWKNHCKFPLMGITLEELAAWPGSPRSTKFLGWGKQRWQLEPHHSHFILVPGSQFGDEAPWIVEAATLLSKGHSSVTILINGGEISRKEVELSLEHDRPVIALRRTGRLADELAQQPNRHELVTVVPADSAQRIVEAVQSALSVRERSVLSKSTIRTS
jgi:hypothetical protein